MKRRFRLTKDKNTHFFSGSGWRFSGIEVTLFTAFSVDHIGNCLLSWYWKGSIQHADRIIKIASLSVVTLAALSEPAVFGRTA